MTMHPSSNWSESLQQRTREAIAQLPLTPDGNIHFKHATLGFAYATLNDLMNDQLVLRSKAGNQVFTFDNVDALIQAAWALD
jgi:hypothetical protein